MYDEHAMKLERRQKEDHYRESAMSNDTAAEPKAVDEVPEEKVSSIQSK